MSYEDKLSKVKAAPLSLTNIPKYLDFYKKHGTTPNAYINNQNELLKKSLIGSDVNEFIKKDPVLAQRRQRSEEQESETKLITYFNTDLQKYVTQEVPVHMTVDKGKSVSLSLMGGRVHHKKHRCRIGKCNYESNDPMHLYKHTKKYHL